MEGVIRSIEYAMGTYDGFSKEQEVLKYMMETVVELLPETRRYVHEESVLSTYTDAPRDVWQLVRAAMGGRVVRKPWDCKYDRREYFMGSDPILDSSRIQDRLRRVVEAQTFFGGVRGTVRLQENTACCKAMQIEDIVWKISQFVGRKPRYLNSKSLYDVGRSGSLDTAQWVLGRPNVDESEYKIVHIAVGAADFNRTEMLLFLDQFHPVLSELVLQQYPLYEEGDYFGRIGWFFWNYTEETEWIILPWYGKITKPYFFSNVLHGCPEAREQKAVEHICSAFRLHDSLRLRVSLVKECCSDLQTTLGGQIRHILTLDPTPTTAFHALGVVYTEDLFREIAKRFSIELDSFRDPEGKNLLHVLAMWSSRFFKEYCIRLKHLVNEQDLQGNTPLHCIFLDRNFSSWEEKKMIEALCSNGANLLLKNKAGSTPIDIVRRHPIESCRTQRLDILQKFIV